MDAREAKGLQIAGKFQPYLNNGTWIVPSQSGPGSYKVKTDAENPRCSCPDYELRKMKCKHIYAVEFTILAEQTTETVEQAPDGSTKTTTVTETVKVTYKQEWSAYNTAQTQEKTLFQKFLFELCKEVAEPVQEKRGKGRPRLSIRDMIFATTFKVYSTVSSRRFISDLSDAQAKGYIERLPHFNSIFNYLELETLTPVLQELISRSALPLKALETDFAVDSSGFSTCQYVQWYNAKYGTVTDNHDWIKMHVMTGVRTNVVTSVEISDRNSHDSPFLPALVEDTAKYFNVKEVSADKGYSSVDNHNAIAKIGAQPYIAFKGNATGAVGGLFGKMFYYFSYNKEQFLTHYHHRSNVESTFNMIKAKFGSRIRSKTPVAQVNEALCKVLCHNLCCVIQSIFEFGIEANFCAEIEPAQKMLIN
jgi:transposase